jgi:hypothetical protein
MWAAIGIMLRVYVQRERSLELGGPLFPKDELQMEGEMDWASTEPPQASTPFFQ